MLREQDKMKPCLHSRPHQQCKLHHPAPWPAACKTNCSKAAAEFSAPADGAHLRRHGQSGRMLLSSGSAACHHASCPGCGQSYLQQGKDATTAHPEYQQKTVTEQRHASTLRTKEISASSITAGCCMGSVKMSNGATETKISACVCDGAR